MKLSNAKEVMEALLVGKKVRRSPWGNKDYYLYLSQEGILKDTYDAAVKSYEVSNGTYTFNCHCLDIDYKFNEKDRYGN